MANENRRPGDWQRRDQRRDANDLVGREPSTKKWYQRNVWIVALTLVFFPVGLVLVWRSDWHVVFKVLATLYVAVAVYFSVQMSQAVQQLGA